MKKIISLITFLFIGITLSLGLSSCNGAKAYTKKGAKMEAAGMIDQASDYYFTALQKKPGHLDAMTGLKRTGQRVLSRHLVAFDEALTRNDRESAIAAFQKADEYNQKAAAFGVVLACLAFLVRCLACGIVGGALVVVSIPVQANTIFFRRLGVLSDGV